MTLPMDIRMASTGAKIGFVFTKRASCPKRRQAGSFRSRRHQPSAGEDVLGQGVHDQRVHRAGLIRSLHEPEDLVPAARELAAIDRRRHGGVVLVATVDRRLAHARCRSPDGSPQSRQPHDRRTRSRRRCGRGRQRLSRCVQRARASPPPTCRRRSAAPSHVDAIETQVLHDPMASMATDHFEAWHGSGRRRRGRRRGRPAIDTGRACPSDP